MAAPLATKLVTAAGVLLYGSQGGTATPIQIRNMDTVNTVWVGNVSNLTTDGSNSIPLGPGDSQAFDGSVSIYGIVVNGGPAVIVAIVPGGMSFAPGTVDISGPVTATISGPVTVSGPVDITGIGGFVLPGQLALGFSNPGGVSASAGSGTNIVTAMDVSTYGSLIFRCNGGTSNSVAAGAAVCAQWVFTWLDATGNALASHMVSVMLGMNLTIQMPITGSKLLVQLFNVGSIGTITYGAGNVFLWGDYRTVNSPYILNNSVSIGGLTAVTGWVVIPPVNPALTVGNWISNLQSNKIPVSASTQYLMPLTTWCGDVLGWFQQTGNPLAFNATIIDLSYAVQGGIAPGSGYTGGIIETLALAVGTVPIEIEYNGTPTQLAFAFETTATLGDTFLMLTGRS